MKRLITWLPIPALVLLSCCLLAIGCGGGGGGGGGTVTTGGLDSPVGPGTTGEVRGTIREDGVSAGNVTVMLVRPEAALAQGVAEMAAQRGAIRGDTLYAQGFGEFSTTTAADGSFALTGVPLDTNFNLVAVRDATHQALHANVRAGAAGSVLAATIDVRLTPTGTLSGVLQIQGNSTNRWGGVAVYLDGTSYMAMTADDGKWTIKNIPVGTYTVKMMMSGYDGNVAQTVSVLPGQTVSPTQSMWVAPRATTPTTGDIAGTATRIGFAPGDSTQAGTLVYIKDTSWVTFTDNAGAYRFAGLPAGNYTVMFPSREYDAVSPGSTLAVTVTAGSTTTAPTAQLAPKATGATLGGFVGIASKTLLLPNDTDNGGIIAQLTGVGGIFVSTSNSTGQFEFRQVPAGNYVLSFPAVRYRYTGGPIAVTVPTTTPATYNVSPIDAPAIESDFVGQIAKQQLLPGDVDQAGVLVQLSRNGITRLTTSAADGRFRFTNLALGSDYVLSVPDSRYQYGGGTVVVPVTLTASTTPTVYTVTPRTPPPAPLPGIFRGGVSKQPPVNGETDNSNVVVQLVNASFTFTTNTNNMGGFGFENIPTGIYQLVFPPGLYRLQSAVGPVTVTSTLGPALPPYVLVPIDPTAVGGAPVVMSVTPHNVNDVEPNATLQVVFDRNIVAGAGTINIRRQSDDAIVQSLGAASNTVQISGARATLVPSSLPTGTGFWVEIPNGAFMSLSGQPFAGLSTSATWRFTTRSTLTPTITTRTPAPNAILVPHDTTIEITFDVPMALSAVNGTGFSVLLDSTAVAGTRAFAANSDNKRIVFTPTAPLAASTTYQVVAGTTLLDAQNRALAASSTWTFTTAPAWGSTWLQRFPAPIPPAGMYFTMTPFNNTLYVMGGVQVSASMPVGMNPGIWSSPDGETWTQAVASAPFSRQGQRTVVFNNKLWAIAGVDA